jgi:hypothetical protein
MQNVFIMPDPMAPQDPTAWVANSVNIYRNDQGICWKILDPTGLVKWATTPFVFADKPAWPGQTPRAVPNPRGGLTLYTADGPGENITDAPQRFTYTIYIDVPGHGTVPVNANVPVDPDIWNQPQP